MPAKPLTSPRTRRVVSKVRRVLCEALERRQHLSTTTLINGTGPGALSVGVDPFGAFGFEAVGEGAQFGNFTVGGTGVIRRSSIFFSPLRRFLSPVDPTLDLNGEVIGGVPTDVTFTAASPTFATSSFVLSGTDLNTSQPFSYRFDLVQSLGTPELTPLSRFVTVSNQFQSVLTQTYTITNLLGTDTNFSVIRHIEREDSFADFSLATLLGGGGLGGFGLDSFHASLDGGRTLISGVTQLPGITIDPNFPLSEATIASIRENTLAASGYLQVQSSGGDFNSFVGAAVRPTGLDAKIAGQNPPLPSTVGGSLPAFVGLGTLTGIDGAGTSGLSVVEFADAVADTTGVQSTLLNRGLAQQFDYRIGGRQSVVFTTRTTFAQGAPIELINSDPALISTPAATPGTFAFSSPQYNYNFPADDAGTFSPLIVRVVRQGGTSGAATVNLTLRPASGNTVPGVSLAASSVVFADGQQSVDVVLNFTSAVGVEPTRFDLVASSATGGVGVGTPAITTINVTPRAAVFTYSQPTYSVLAGASSLTVTINRTGSLNGAASVTFATAGGTAVPGTDYTPVAATLLTFADGEASKTIQVPLLKGQSDGVVRTIGLTLTPARPDGAVTGLLSNVPTPAGTINFNSVDATGPVLSTLATVPGRNNVSALLLTFSEALTINAGLDPFQLFLRVGEGPAGSGRTVPVALSSASYDAATRTVRLNPVRPLALNRTYQLTLRPSATLTDLAGNVLNRTLTQPAGTPTIQYFARATRISYVDNSGDNVTLQIRNGSFDLVRSDNGEAATVTLFRNSPAASVFTGSVRGRGRTSTIGRILNAANVTVSLPSTITTVA